MDVAQPTRICAANRSSLSNGAVQLTALYKQIFLPPVNFFATQVLLYSRVVYLKVLSRLSLYHVKDYYTLYFLQIANRIAITQFVTHRVSNTLETACKSFFLYVQYIV